MSREKGRTRCYQGWWEPKEMSGSQTHFFFFFTRVLL